MVTIIDIVIIFFFFLLTIVVVAFITAILVYLFPMMQKLPVEGTNPSHDVVEAGGNMDETVTCEENVTGELQQVNELFRL